MIDYYDFDGTPTDEQCAQTGAVEYDYWTLQRIECHTLQSMIERTMKVPTGVSFRLKSNDHDAGVYHSLSMSFDDEARNIDAIWDFINEVDQIAQWDRQAIQELQDAGYPIDKFIDEERIWKAPSLQGL